VKLTPEPLVFTAGSILFEEGDPGGSLYLIQEGKVEIFRKRDNTEVLFTVMGPGEVIGAVTLFSKESRTASARAQTDVSLQFYQANKIDQAIKEIPLWIQAVLKDTIVRLKAVDSQLVESKLQEKKLEKSQMTTFHFGIQMAKILSFFARFAKRQNDNIEVCLVDDILIYAQEILMKEEFYIQKIFSTFVESGLVKKDQDKKYGLVIINPNHLLLDESSNFLKNVIKQGTDKFVPSKYYPWMSGLIRIYKKTNNTVKHSFEFLAESLNKELARNNGPEILKDLIKYGVVRSLDAENTITFDPLYIQRRIVFENLARLLKILS
jgi:CRP/FNR family transcriptional regulator, cyclic AMP receptor protein